MNKNKLKSIIDDIWNNYKSVILIGFLASILLSIHFNEMDLIWYITSMLIVNGGNIGCLIYGIIQYFKK